MNGPGTHSSGPRPKSHVGSPAMTSSPTLEGDAQLKCAVPLVELPDGAQWTPSCWPLGFPAGLLSSTTMNRLSGGDGTLKKNEPSAPRGDWVTNRPLAFELTSNVTQLKYERPCESTARTGSLAAS